MIEDEENTAHLSMFPTELLLYIFTYLSGRQLIRCREVCSRWKIVIDGTVQSDFLWRRHTVCDFKNICFHARQRTRTEILWFELYRNLCAWRILSKAVETRDEFASASMISQEIRGFEILPEGSVGVHTKGSIDYYDIETLARSRRGVIHGDFSRYTETTEYLILMNFHLHLFIIRKLIPTKTPNSITFNNVKTFILIEHKVYFVNLNDEIHICNLQNWEMEGKFIKKSDDCIMCLGSTDEKLHILTFQRNIYTLEGRDLVFECCLGPNTNLLHQLRKYNFLDQLDWRIYFQWMYILSHTVPDGPLRDIVTIRAYGDAYFVGSNWGVLRIYFAPYPDGEFDIFNTEPVKQYNFMERYDCPVLSMCPILMIDVMEGERGHTVLIAMPKKIAVLNFNHDYETPQVQAVLSIEEKRKLNCTVVVEEVDPSPVGCQ
ncbi:uncharacterized protein LOC115452850 [Manduca sexta]|uniref:F-box domain-containing protein n=1 Tax=Manduca sexta TaxID=7130 RepID=A0A921ZVC8_MANSE|nr:uncharacterized protein LOC115452850 [Manduca sexta]KAG6464141.1 hypothetical protein O3G_MSEX014309 [Manduca sexta]